MNQKDLESSLKRLEEIVNILNGEDISLEESLKLYSEGVELSGDCMQKLESARQIVEQGKNKMMQEHKE